MNMPRRLPLPWLTNGAVGFWLMAYPLPLAGWSTLLTTSAKGVTGRPRMTRWQ
jgi:hypothetical protein